MKRFDYDESGDFQDDNQFSGMGSGDISPEEYAEMMKRQDAMNIMQIEFAGLELNQRLLFKTVKMLEKSFWWKFKSISCKTRQIYKTYHALKMLVCPPRKE